MTSQGGEEIVRMEGIVKRFPGVLANDRIDFKVRRGEVHALLGENGAGKTTLMNVLYGIHRPDEGRIYVRDRPAAIRSPKDAISLGIGMVHQHFKLVESHTVLENILLGLKEPKFRLNLEESEKQVAELSEKYKLKVDPQAKIWQLSMGERQRVEILKILYRGADILILDEPTSVLTPLETTQLFEFLKQMAREGRSVIFITHKLDEVLAVSDRVTVLRAGRLVDTVETACTTKSDLAMMMVGRKVLFTYSKPATALREPVLELKELRVMGDKGLPALKGVSLVVHRGEILGIAGIAGNGQSELAEAVVGMRPAESGRIVLGGKDVTGKPIKRIIEDGVAYIPEDRVRVAAPQNLTVAENLVLRSYRYSPYSRGLLLQRKEIDRNAETLIPEFNIMTPSKNALSRTLSGGNLQRLVLARELSGKPKLIVAVYPTRGLDVGATEHVRTLLLKQRSSGAGILLISEDLEEIISLSDEIAVMYAGEIVGLLPAAEADMKEMGLMMGGALRKV